MGRLFWKFFLTFWLAVSTAGLVVGGVVWVYQTTEHPRDGIIAQGPPPALIVALGESVLTSSGVDALRAMMSRLETEEPFHLFAVDEQGHELLGRTVDSSALARASQLAQATSPQRSVRRVRLTNGDTYLLFVPALPHRFNLGPLEGAAEEALDPERSPPWISVLVGVVASIFFSALLAWYMAKPVRHLRRAMHAAADGDLDIRIQPMMGTRQDELADLGREFDRMAGRLKTLIEAQRQLFHTVSHELRSPLARLHAAIGLARQDPQHAEETLERIETESSRLDKLVGELLLLARLESGVPATGISEVDLFELVEDIVYDARVEARAKAVTIEVQGRGHALTLGPEQLLAQAFENIIRNAVKYTPTGSQVLVSTRLLEDGGPFELVVADQGPGIAEADLPAIFDAFYRGRDQGHQQEGYGLGLAIARRAIEAQDGEIQVKNRAAGGLEVSIRLKLRPPVSVA